MAFSHAAHYVLILTVLAMYRVFGRAGNVKFKSRKCPNYFSFFFESFLNFGQKMARANFEFILCFNF